MTEKQKKFADEYLSDLNATRAYKAAYPSIKNDKSAAAASARLLRNINIQNYVETCLAKISSMKIADAREVMEYLTSVLRGQSQAEVIAVEGTGEGRSSARTMTKRPDEKEKLKAAELIGKRYKMFTDNVTLEGVVPVVFSGENELKD